MNPIREADKEEEQENGNFPMRRTRSTQARTEVFTAISHL